MALMAGDRRLVLPGLYTIGLAVIAGLAATITPRTHWAMVTAGHSAFAALFAVLIGAAAAAPATDVCKRLLSHPVLVWIGRRSYGIYVYHVPIFVALEAFRVKGSLVNLVLVTLARLLLTLAVAEASYRLIEQPLLRLKRFFYPAQRSTETPPRAEPPRSAREPLAPAPIAPAQPV